MSDGARVSPYLQAGAPTRFSLPGCRKPFDGAAIHGEDGRYYCSTNCADTGRTSSAQSCRCSACAASTEAFNRQTLNPEWKRKNSPKHTQGFEMRVQATV